MAKKSLGQLGYEAYADYGDWKTFDGREMPVWMDLGFETQRRWEAAAVQVVAAYLLREKP